VKNKKSQMKKSILLCAGSLVSSVMFAQVRVTDINSGGASSNPFTLTVVNNELHFSADNGTTGHEPYILDSGENLFFLGDLNSGSASSSTGSYISFQNNTYFIAATSANSHDLIKYDGVSVQGVPSTGSAKQFDIFNENALRIFNNELVFGMNAGNLDFGTELYGYSGSGFIAMIEDINPNFPGSIPNSFIEMNGDLYFAATTQAEGDELWVYRSANNTVSLVADINPGVGDGVPNFSGSSSLFTVYNNELYFLADDGVNGNQLYSYDGTNPPVAHIINSTGSSNPENMYVVNNKLFFSAIDSNGDMSMYSYDGVNPPFSFSDTIVSRAQYKGDLLLFAYDDGINGTELWQFDGVNPPEMVVDIFPGAGSSLSFTSFSVHNRYEVIGDTFYFAADDGINGNEVWAYDGVNPPMLVADIFPGAQGSNPRNFENFNAALYFSAEGDEFGREVWRIGEQNPAASLMENNPNIELVVYPNPASEIVKIKTSASILGVVIYDVNGKEVLSFDDAKTTYNLSDIDKGTYFVKIETNKGSVNRKIILL